MTKEGRVVQHIKKKLAEMGLMLPGSISKQWNVCGNPNCRCKNRNNPIKHGPYYQLSFTVAGKSSTMFIQKEYLPEVRRCIKRHQQFKILTTALVQACIEQARKNKFRRK